MASADIQLDSLTISETTHRLWDCHSEEDRNNLRALVRPLRRLRLFLRATRGDAHDGWAEDPEIDYDMRNYQAGRFRAMLTDATNLRVLKLQFPPLRPYQDSFRAPDLRDLLGDLTFPQLYELAISRSATNSAYLRSVILRHRATLRRLTISRIHLVSNDFEAFVESIAGRLPNLQEVTLRGVSTPGPWDIWCCTGSYSFHEYPERSVIRYNAENFILRGHAAHDWSNDRRFDKVEDYVQPCLPDDNPMTDDPRRDYSWDEFDDRILPPREKYAW